MQTIERWVTKLETKSNAANEKGMSEPRVLSIATIVRQTPSQTISMNRGESLIHLALWIISTIFVIWFFVVCGTFVLAFISYAWRWILGAIALLIVIVFVNINSDKRPKEPLAGTTPQVQTVSSEKLLLDNEKQELKDSIETAISAANHDAAPPIPEFETTQDRLSYLRWLGAMSFRLQLKKPDWDTRKEFLQTLWFESRRAGLDTALVLALIESASDFRAFAVNDADSRGYMGVNSRWSSPLGDGDVAKLFHMQTNLRFGCVLLRQDLDEQSGDLSKALASYYAKNLASPATNIIKRDTFVTQVLISKQHWDYSEDKSQSQ